MNTDTGIRTALRRRYLLALLVLSAVLAFAPRPVGAQDAFHQWVLEMLEEEFSVSGGDFILGANEITKLNDANWIYDSVNPPGTSTTQRHSVDPSEDLPFTSYTRYLHPIVTNEWYDSGTRWVGVRAISEGDVALLVLFVRGESSTGGLGTVEIIFDENDPPYDRALSEEWLLSSDWEQVLIPFQMPFDKDAGKANFGLNFGHLSGFVDVAAPVVLNYGSKYTVEGLQGLIDSGGQAPLLASFTQSMVRGGVPFEATFDASNSSAPGTIVSYAWDFGDGGHGTGVTATHTYTEIGRYTVTLTVTDDAGASDSATREVIAFDGRGLPASPLEIPYTDSAPEIDGDLDAAWQAAVLVPIENLVADNPPSSAADLTAAARAMWNADRLFVLYEVDDESLHNDSPLTWQDDSVELYVDGGNEKTSSYDANDAQYELGWGATDLTGTSADTPKAAGVVFATVSTSTGYRVEVSVPWSSLGVVAVTDDLVGIDFFVNDDDTGGNFRQTKLSWYSLQDNAYARLDGIATARLVGGEGLITAAKIDLGLAEILTNVPVSFDGSRSVAPGTIVSYAWQFGDGSSAEGAMVQHSYGTTGSFVLTLTITDDQGNSATATRTVAVIDGLGRPRKPLRIPRALTTPTVDGAMELAWELDAVPVALRQVVLGTVDSDADLSATAWVMWDESGLHVLVDVVDDAIHTEHNDVWQRDGVEIYVDGDDAKTAQAYDQNDAQFALPLNGTQLTGRRGRDGMDEGVLFASADTEDGYIVEMTIPWTSVQTSASEGVRIGFEVQVNDDDDGNGRDAKLAWFDASDNAWQWANVFGTAVLSTIHVDAEEETQLPDRFAIESVYPNPFNPSTTALVSVRQSGIYDVRVYNVLGQLVERRTLEVEAPMRVEVGFDFSGRASGVYLIAVEHRDTGRIVSTRATLVK